MTWTYDETLPTDRDRLRFLVGDIESAEPLLTDEAADVLLGSLEDGPTKLEAAAASACRAIAARFARRVDFGQGDLSVSASQRAARYAALAAEFQSRVDAAAKTSGVAGRAGGLGLPVVGGVPVVDLARARRNRAVSPIAGVVGSEDRDSVTFAPISPPDTA